jgi:hypothetical protein
MYPIEKAVLKSAVDSEAGFAHRSGDVSGYPLPGDRSIEARSRSDFPTASLHAWIPVRCRACEKGNRQKHSKETR